MKRFKCKRCNRGKAPRVERGWYKLEYCTLKCYKRHLTEKSMERYFDRVLSGVDTDQDVIDFLVLKAL